MRGTKRSVVREGGVILVDGRKMNGFSEAGFEWIFYEASVGFMLKAFSLRAQGQFSISFYALKPHIKLFFRGIIID